MIQTAIPHKTSSHWNEQSMSSNDDILCQCLCSCYFDEVSVLHDKSFAYLQKKLCCELFIPVKFDSRNHCLTCYFVGHLIAPMQLWIGASFDIIHLVNKCFRQRFCLVGFMLLTRWMIGYHQRRIMSHSIRGNDCWNDISDGVFFNASANCMCLEGCDG